MAFALAYRVMGPISAANSAAETTLIPGIANKRTYGVCTRSPASSRSRARICC